VAEGVAVQKPQAAQGLEQIRQWLAMLVKTFRLTRFELCWQVIDGDHAAVHS